MKLKWRELDNKVNELKTKTLVNSLRFQIHSWSHISYLVKKAVQGKTCFISFLYLWTLMQEVKREIKSLETLNEKLDYIQNTWQTQGMLGDVNAGGSCGVSSCFTHVSCSHHQWSSMLGCPSLRLWWKRNVWSEPASSHKQSRYCKHLSLVCLVVVVDRQLLMFQEV